MNDLKMDTWLVSAGIRVSTASSVNVRMTACTKIFEGGERDTPRETGEHRR